MYDIRPWMRFRGKKKRKSHRAYADLMIISPTTISEKPLIVQKQYLARGVKFKGCFYEIQCFV